MTFRPEVDRLLRIMAVIEIIPINCSVKQSFNVDENTAFMGGGECPSFEDYQYDKDSLILPQYKNTNNIVRLQKEKEGCYTCKNPNCKLRS